MLAVVNAKHQQGYLIPLAALIVVGIATFALAINKLSGSNSTAAIYEGISLRAFYAAQSGAQFGMNQLFFSTDTRAQRDSQCAALDGDTLSFTANGLQGCSTNLACSVSTDAGNTKSFYLVTSAASCGGGDFLAQRSVRVRAFSD